MFTSIEEVQRLMEAQSYIADRALATTLFLAIKLEKPIFLEGEAGVGKTEVAKVLSKILQSRLIRLQCYEGLDANTALYEWNYSKQMLKIKLEEGGGRSRDELEHLIFSQEFLLKRPLLDAIMSDGSMPPVLLIDEVDRSDEEFEAFLLEVLSDFQITIPEIGTIQAERRPFVILTSNRTREIHDALKRRCLYLWLDYPSFEKEYEIVRAKIPGIQQTLAEQICTFMQKLRQVSFYKRPGIAETLDWAQALLHLNQATLVPETVRETVGCILKYHEDVEKFKRDEMERVVPEF
ncbi:MAG: MoxR family ATPase [Candidatus Tectomicrobia bacterium]|jgi:MoxR-like ATPase|nr:MoxR family ATPase [Candidatus Tectomicrobia bacterium]HEX2275815.1 MoxR family ATPase [Candidatus Tectomicrobia bacterium]